MKPKFVSLAIVALLFGAALFLLTGCVTIPVPPFGSAEQRGSLGKIHVAVSVRYIPLTNPDLPGDDSLKYAWAKFGEAKVLKDK